MKGPRSRKTIKDHNSSFTMTQSLIFTVGEDVILAMLYKI